MNQSLSTRNPHQEDGIVELLKKLLGGTKTIAVLPSAARTVSTTSAEFDSEGFRTLLLYLNVSAITGAPSLTLRLQGKDPTSGQWATVATTSAAVTGVTCFQWAIGPGLGGAQGTVTNSPIVGTPIPAQWRAQVIAGTADSVTYSLTGVAMA